MATGDPPQGFYMDTTTDQTGNVWIAQWATSSGADSGFAQTVDLSKEGLWVLDETHDIYAYEIRTPLAGRMRMVKNQLDAIISEIEAVL